jgi:anti-sigma factor (TIGR02949 family)
MSKDLDCGDCLERLYAFLEEDLAPDERAAMGTHLADCAPCLDELEAVKRRDAVLAKVRECCGADIAPPALRDRIARLLPPS